MMTIEQYIESINKRYQLGNATEHTFRGDLQLLLESLAPDIRATNEPKRQSCGAPDYILTKKDIPVGFIEAKDIGDKDLDGQKKTGNKEQFDRYKASLNNLIFTDYLDFHLYREGVFISSIKIAELKFPSTEGTGGQFPSNGGVSAGRGDVIAPLPENFSAFTNLIKDFASHNGQTIKSSKRLAEMMAGKARLLSDVIEKALVSDEETNANSTLKDQMNAFRQILIHDITPKAFADVYAQTISYSMFAARLHDPTLKTFSRQEAAELIPKSNPFLRKLFSYIAGPDIDDRIKWIVDSLVDIFLACNAAELLKNYGKSTKTEDPIIHFYETFLSEYDPKLRKARGVWYTPAPVVNFIVRAVDDILKTEFGLAQGLADTSKTKIKTIQQSKATGDARSKIKDVEVEEEVHRVQILDPATGTGTFLAEVVKHIHQKFEGQQGIWSNYVEKHLLPRLNGFELLMASYAMAHLQLDLLLTDTGYKPPNSFPSDQLTTPSFGHPSKGGEQRLRVFLTNSLEESHPETGTLFANWLSSEANEANRIKRDTPVMCVIGNPPYAVSSTNKGPWIEKLTADYKKDLNEQNINSLSDDYVKFIRFGQHFIDKNGSGVLAYISNNSFLDGIIHRQMRKHLLESFDTIYILDLHGNAKKKEVSTDGSADQNVLDIMQGVSINIFIKTGKKKSEDFAKVLQYDLRGKRDYKYAFLKENVLKSILWEKLDLKAPHFYFVKKDFNQLSQYETGFKVEHLFDIKGSGIKFRKDNLLVKNHFSSASVERMILEINTLSKSAILKAYNFKETEDWMIDEKKKFFKMYDYGSIIPINYRPFDNRFTYYPIDTINEIIPRGDSRRNLMRNIVMGSLGFVCFRQSRNDEIGNFWITTNPISKDVISSLDSATVFPLYLYPEKSSRQTLDSKATPPLGHPSSGGELRSPNLNQDIVNAIAEKLGLTFVEDHEKIPEQFQLLVEAKGLGEAFVRPYDWGYHQCFTPLDILDYIYAVLHSPAYREKYKEFLKIDFPRVPYPKDENTFWQLVNLGGEIRELHLLESPVVEKYITQYPVDGDNVVGKIRFVNSPSEFILSEDEVEGCPQDGVVKNAISITNIPIILNPILDLPYNPNLKARATELRKAENLPEVLFWMQVNQKKFHGIDFDRQRVIGNYIVDFYIKKLGLVVEIDGSSHDDKEEYDAEREAYLVSLGLKVYRIKVIDVIKRMGYVLQGLENYIISEYRFEPPLGGADEPPRPSGGVDEPPRPSGTPPLEGNKGKVWINETQYFDNVPEVAWNFYIGGYQPAQKWLKDRKERTLEFDDILHYQKIIVALTKTDRLMKNIDKVRVE